MPQPAQRPTGCGRRCREGHWLRADPAEDVGIVRIGGKRRAAIGLKAVACICVVGINAALRAILGNGKTPVAIASIFCALRDPGQHDHGHQRMAARTLHVGDELGGIRVANLGVVEVLEVIVVRGVVGEKLPVVARGGIAAPANDTQSAVGDRGRILRISTTVNIGDDRVTVAERVDCEVDIGGGWSVG